MNYQRTMASPVRWSGRIRFLMAVLAAGTLGAQASSSAQGLQAGSPWPMFHQNDLHTGRGVGSGAPGTLQWTFATGAFVYSPPVIGADGTIYVGSVDDNFYAINGADGSKKWKFTTGNVVSRAAAIGSNGTIYVGSGDNNVYAIDLADGIQKWKFTTGGHVYSSPAIGSDGTIYVGSDDFKVYAINPSDGSQKWAFPTGSYVETSPAIGSDGTIYVGTLGNDVFALNPTDGSQKWEFATGGSVSSSPVIGSNGTIYVGSNDNNVYAINPADGSQKWKFNTGNQVGSSPAIGADGTIYVGSYDWNLFAITDNGTSASLKWEFATGDYVGSSPAIGADGTIYVGSDDDYLYAIADNGTSASLKWKFKTGNAVESSPAIGADGTIYVGSDDYKLYAIGKPVPSVTLSTSLNPAAPATPITFTATVSAVAPATGIPTGTVTFLDGTTILGTQTLSSGVATFSTSSLASGLHAVTASYGGDSNFTVSSSDLLNQFVGRAGSVWAWGDDTYGDLGNNGTTQSNVPVQVEDPTGTSHLAGVVAVTSGYYHSLALKSDGTAWAWGYNSSGDLGDNSTTDSGLPVQVKDPTGTSYLTGVVAISGGYDHSLALKSDGTVWAWGFNADGELGNNSTTQSNVPVQVNDLTGAFYLSSISAIAAGYHHSLAAKSDGTVRAWGYNSNGELGNNSTSNSSLPVQVEDSTGTSYLRGVIAVAAGDLFSLALKSDGTVWAWGYNGEGELGNTNVPLGSRLPVQVEDPSGTSYLTGITAISASGTHGLALKSDGTAWSWGGNGSGQLGNNSTVGSTLPVQVKDPTGASFLTGIVTVEAGDSDSLALKNDGSAWAWGANASGQLGSNSTTASSLPVQVKGPAGASYLSGVVAIAADLIHSIAIGNPASSIVLASSRNPSGVGQPITFTATVSAKAPATGTPTGTVTFLDGSTTPVTQLGVANLSTGVAAVTISTLASGSHAVTATYSGDGNFQSASSTTLNQVVLQAASAALTSSQNPSVFGQSVTFTATVSGGVAGGLTPTGTVTFLDGTTTPAVQLGSGTLSKGVTVLSTSALSVGSHKITASYGGDTNFSSATSTAFTQTISQGSATVGLASNLNQSSLGQSVTLTATVSATAPAFGTPTGTVTFLDGTTTPAIQLGTGTLSKGVAVLATSAVSGGSRKITASYGGDTNFTSAISAALTQVVENVWLPADVSVGADDLSRILWTDPGGQAVLWSVERTTGDYAQGPVFGPYDGGAWHATRIACGRDGYSHILWNKGDGTLSLWLVNVNNTIQSNMIYGPYAGWVATDISVGPLDNLTRILWTNTNGQALVWSVNSTTGNYTAGPTYGPYPGYTAVALACGADGLTRLLWANPLGIASLWVMNAQNQYQSSTIFGPYAGWIPTDIDVGSDHLARVLWTNTVDGRAIVWSVDASGNASDNQNFYGPFTGYTAHRVACGTDGFTRLTWVSTGGVLSFWHMASNNTILTFNIYGPFVSP